MSFPNVCVLMNHRDTDYEIHKLLEEFFLLLRCKVNTQFIERAVEKERVGHITNYKIFQSWSDFH